MAKCRRQNNYRSRGIELKEELIFFKLGFEGHDSGDVIAALWVGSIKLNDLPPSEENRYFRRSKPLLHDLGIRCGQ